MIIKILIKAIKLYQKYISRFIPRQCRYYPTCSEYTIQVLEKYGFIRGIGKAVWRILRCNPFSSGGYDPS
jgi:putative membrane protein insertion efficiency factor